MKFSNVTSLLIILLSSSSFPSPSSSFALPSSSPSSSSCGKTPSSIPSRRITAPFGLPLAAASSSTTSCVEAPSTDVVSGGNWGLLSERGQRALADLINGDAEVGAQRHVYGDWPEAGVQDEEKVGLAEQLADLNESYPGGLEAYLSKARSLLSSSAAGLNPFDGFTASIPTGEILNYEDDAKGTMPFSEAEELGLESVSRVAFVLVAGGLGERLGYSGIKLGLETNLVSEVVYLQMYVKYIQAFERMSEVRLGEKVKIPLVIMTSGDTDPLTRELLKENDYFGMDESQIKVIKQDKVPALKDASAGLSLKSRFEVETKPHGHGDVHHLLWKSGLVDEWESEGREYVVFLQDTNALIINSVLATLGVSRKRGFHMNTICIPRLAGEAAGAIARLDHESDPEKSLVINVEYNQLDPLLRSQGDGAGDIPDPKTGYSPYPGNSNILVMELTSYAKTLRGEDKGVVDEFVNPKYKDDTRTEFKKPTRLECMMQDFPKLLQKEMGSEANVGFTMFDRWFTFSPAKNSLEAGIDSVKAGRTDAGTMSSAESDKYIQNQRKLARAGVKLPVSDCDDDTTLVSLAGIPVTPGPRIILCPGFAMTQSQITEKISGGEITSRSSLILEGDGLKVKNLSLDGALVIRAKDGCDVQVDGLVVSNKGWEVVEVEEGEEGVPEEVAIRGYRMVKHEAMEIHITEPGKYKIGKEGIVERLD